MAGPEKSGLVTMLLKAGMETDLMVYSILNTLEQFNIKN